MSEKRRVKVDVNNLIKSSFKVDILNDDLRELMVEFPGPSGTPYEGGVWLVRVELPDQYPYKSPSVAFQTPIFHPNVDEHTGAVCLDVINQTWTPMFGLVNIFESFLPQLLAYPNPSDPLNIEAAALSNRSTKEYVNAIKKFIEQYAQPKARHLLKETKNLNEVGQMQNEEGDFSSDLSPLEDFSDDDNDEQ